MKAVIMAGGLGQRLRPFTYVTPKPLLPVNNMCSIEFLIKELKNYNVEEVFISVNYLKEKFDVCYSYEKKYGVKITLIEEEERMGTVGSLSLMKNFLDDNFIVLNGDLFTSINYKKMLNKFNKTAADAMICVKKEATTSPYGVVSYDENDQLIAITEKPTYFDWINAGIYLFSPGIISHIKKEYFDMPDLLRTLKKENKKIIIFDIGEKWLDIGKVEDYEEASTIINNW
ncbi:MAG: hypothetical protein CL712_00075 [Chloroflexi bacterium]|nr:hypothetical protein [Chloroflexota bacterium]|tara:strand:- start:634 stop:1320 length:687 start_codon:yes stop_codon:yes gene_type:complete